MDAIPVITDAIPATMDVIVIPMELVSWEDVEIQMYMVLADRAVAMTMTPI